MIKTVLKKEKSNLKRGKSYLKTTSFLVIWKNFLSWTSREQHKLLSVKSFFLLPNETKKRKKKEKEELECEETIMSCRQSQLAQ
jgi:hypothetical protein